MVDNILGQSRGVDHLIEYVNLGSYAEVFIDGNLIAKGALDLIDVMTFVIEDVAENKRWDLDSEKEVIGFDSYNFSEYQMYANDIKDVEVYGLKDTSFMSKEGVSYKPSEMCAFEFKKNALLIVEIGD